MFATAATIAAYFTTTVGITARESPLKFSVIVKAALTITETINGDSLAVVATAVKT